MTLTRVFLPVEKPLRDWMRTQPDLAALVAARTFVGIPDSNPTYPLINLQRVAGGPDGSDTNVDNPVIQCDCWADRGGRLLASQVAHRLMSVFESMSRTPLPGGPIVLGAKVTLGPLWRPDPAIDRPRYQVDVQLTTTSPG
jgi:hypothetical protein